MTNSTETLKATIQESVKQALVEDVSVRRAILENRVALINEMIDLSEADWMDRARSWIKNKYLGADQAVKDTYRNKVQVNPQQITNDPKRVSGLLDQSLAKTKKEVMAFKADALRSSEAINRLQDSVFDLFGKFFHLLDSIPPEARGKYEREVMQVVGAFYSALMEEKKRIEVYISALAKEAGTQGYNLGQSATAMAGYKPQAAPSVVGSRVVDPEAEDAPISGLAGARA